MFVEYLLKFKKFKIQSLFWEDIFIYNLEHFLEKAHIFENLGIIFKFKEIL